jgi:hypothetical protein
MTVVFRESLNERRRFLVSIPDKGRLLEEKKKKTGYNEIIRLRSYDEGDRVLNCRWPMIYYPVIASAGEDIELDWIPANIANCGRVLSPLE